MLFNLVVLCTTFILIRWIENKNIFKSWFLPLKRRGNEFFRGFGLMAILCLLLQFGLAFLTENPWLWSAKPSFIQLTESLYYDLNSVLFEELLFRGITLYLLIRYVGSRPGIWISACCFGIYHWITQGVWGNPVAMILVFTLTGLMGYVFALAYYKSGSLVLPVGLHLGWNMTNHTIFSAGPNGPMLLEPAFAITNEGLHTLYAMGFHLIVILCCGLLLRTTFLTPGTINLAVPAES